MPRERIALECAVCSRRNYGATKNRQSHPGRTEQRKYCPHCGRHTPHREMR